MTPPTVPEEINWHAELTAWGNLRYADGSNDALGKDRASTSPDEKDALLTLIATALAEAERRGIERRVKATGEVRFELAYAGTLPHPVIDGLRALQRVHP